MRSNDQQFRLRILRGPEVDSKTGRGRSTRYKRIGEGTFPMSVQLGPRAVGWPEHEVDAVLEAEIAGASPDELQQLVKKLLAARSNFKTAEWAGANAQSQALTSKLPTGMSE
jgi:prophage regulatory protein